MADSSKTEWWALHQIGWDESFAAQDTLESLDGLICEQRDRLSDLETVNASDLDVFSGFRAQEAREHIESLIGVALVMEQTRMGGALRFAARLTELRGTKYNSGELLDLGDRTEGGTATVARSIWELANYFKHRSEWSSWSSTEEQVAKTVRVLRALGCSESADNNFEIGLGALNLARYTDLLTGAVGQRDIERMPMFAVELAVNVWRGQVQDHLRAKFGLKNPLRGDL